MKKLIFPETSKNPQIKNPKKNLPLVFFVLSLAFFLFSLYQGLFLPYALSTPPPGKEQRGEQQALQPFELVVKDAQKLEGMFTLYHNKATDKVYLEIKPEQLNKKFLCFVTLASGLGEAGILSGMPIGDFLFQLRRVQNNVHFVIPNINFRTSRGDPQAGSVERGFSESVLYSLPLKSIHPQRQTLLIDLGDLLMSEQRDLPGLKSFLPMILGAPYSIDADKSYFQEVKAFPLNVEIASVYGFSSENDSSVNYLPSVPDSRAFNLRIHYSFSEVPLNNGYRPRLADERVGYFLTAYKDFSDNSSREPFVRYVNRWHLQKQIPTAPLSPPVQPIVFWIENNVPLEYRNAIREGILMWNKAFEKAGFTEAIQVKQMPDNAKWDPADVRYNTIRWSSSFEPEFAGLGPSRTNPLTGEILDADILLDANIVRQIKQGYRSLVEQNRSVARSFQGGNGANTNPCQFGMYSRYLKLLENGNSETGNKENSPGGIADDLPSLVERYQEQKRSPLSRLMSDSDLCFGLESSQQFAMGAMSMSLLGSTPNSSQIENFVNQYIRFLTAHEVGHTLGLRHNFHGSTMLQPEDLNNIQLTRTQGLVASVMDYVPINLAARGSVQGDYYPMIVGPYDDWAIEYGYKVLGAVNPSSELPMLQQIASRAGEPQLAYAPDEDTFASLDPAANIFDLSANMLRYSQSQLDNSRAMWKRLESRIPVGDDGYNELRVMFDSVFGYYVQQVMNATLYVGGESFNRSRPGDPQGKLPFVPIALSQQREALATLDKYVFAPDAFSFAPELLNKLAPSRWNHWGSPALVFPLDYPIGDRITFLQRFVLRVLLSPMRLARLRDAELKSSPESALRLPEVLDTVQKNVWQEVLQPTNKKMEISNFRRSLQREHLAILIGMVLRKTNVPEDARSLAWYELRQLREGLSKSIRNLDRNADAYTRAHLEETRDRISKVLNAQIESN
jgi:hypothetical protein